MQSTTGHAGGLAFSQTRHKCLLIGAYNNTTVLLFHVYFPFLSLSHNVTQELLQLHACLACVVIISFHVRMLLV